MIHMARTIEGRIDQVITKSAGLFVGYNIEFPMDSRMAPFLNLIEKSQQQLRIVEDLQFYSSFSYLEALIGAADRGVEIEIIYSQYPQNLQNDYIEPLLQKSNVHLFEHEGKLNTHFLVSDNKNYGKEFYFHPKDSLPTIAVSSFHNLYGNVNKYIKLFEELKQQSNYSNLKM